MHQITGFYFLTNKDGRKHVVYSTLYKDGRYCSMHDATGLTDEQARGKFVIEHSNEVDHLLREKNKQQSKIIYHGNES